MQSATEFMQQYFEDHTLEERREQAARSPFRRKYYTDDCYWESCAGTLEMIQTEKVLKASASDATAEVITTRHIPSVHQLRYHLDRNGDGWLIRSVDVWCLSCHGEAGVRECIFCHGTGWTDDREPKAPLPKDDGPRSSRWRRKPRQ